MPTPAGRPLAFSLFVLVLLAGCAEAPTSAPRAGGPDPAARARLAESYGKLPFRFEANRGQTGPEVKFLARGPGYGLFLKPAEAVLTLRKAETAPEKVEEIEGPAPANALSSREKRSRGMRGIETKPAGSPQTASTALRMTLVGADPGARLEGTRELPGKVNYLKCGDPRQWKTGLPTYSKVQASRVYPGIDLVYYGNPRQLEYDFVVAPGADPGQILWAFEGLDRPLAAEPRIDAGGELRLATAGGELRLRKPVAYQEIDGRRVPVEARYELRPARDRAAPRVGFRLAAHDPGRPLVIDPVLVYSTFLGGSGDDYGLGVAVDGAGNAYVTGYTDSSDFPAVNAWESTRRGGADAFIAKFGDEAGGPNQPPTADAGPDRTVRLGTPVSLDGGGSADPDGGPAPLAYHWSQTAGPATVALDGADTAAAGFTPTVPGTYTFSLVVHDGAAASPADTVSVVAEDLPVLVLSPNGGETWQIRTVQTIRWYASGTLANSSKPIRVQFSKNGGKTWSPLKKVKPGANLLQWRPKAGQRTKRAMIRVCAAPLVKKGAWTCDASDGSFVVIR